MRWDDVHDSRAVFLHLLAAQCSPGRAVGPLDGPGVLAEPALDGAAALLMALTDAGTTVAAADRDAATVVAAAASHTGAPTAETAAADFVVVIDDVPAAVSVARRGTAAQPETSATVVVVDRGRDTAVATLSGPGIADRVSADLPAGLARLRSGARTGDRRGVDVFVVRGDRVLALPRTTHVEVVR
ncbi:MULTISPECIES: phosphonate C-P lyase system protein PhnH [unclassified Modestobacter]